MGIITSKIKNNKIKMKVNNLMKIMINKLYLKILKAI
jgi:hypothetical protein